VTGDLQAYTCIQHDTGAAWAGNDRPDFDPAFVVCGLPAAFVIPANPVKFAQPV
jgi:hypothetical protein